MAGPAWKRRPRCGANGLPVGQSVTHLDHSLELSIYALARRCFDLPLGLGRGHHKTAAADAGLSALNTLHVAINESKQPSKDRIREGNFDLSAPAAGVGKHSRAIHIFKRFGNTDLATTIMAGEDRNKSQKTLTGYAPGMGPDLLPRGTGRLLKAGSKIVFQLHYTASGKAETDRSRLGLYLSKEPPAQELRSSVLINHEFKIPPGDREFVTSKSHRFDRDTLRYCVDPRRGGGGETAAGDGVNGIHFIQQAPVSSVQWNLRAGKFLQHAVGQCRRACAATGKCQRDMQAVGIGFVRKAAEATAARRVVMRQRNQDWDHSRDRQRPQHRSRGGTERTDPGLSRLAPRNFEGLAHPPLGKEKNESECNHQNHLGRVLPEVIPDKPAEFGPARGRKPLGASRGNRAGA